MQSDALLAVDIKNLRKNFGTTHALSGINLQVPQGVIFGFLGPNGAGKTTTIRSILNFIRPSAGSIKVLGLDSQKDSVALKSHIGYLAGSVALYQDLTGNQLVELMSELGHMPNADYLKKLVTSLDVDMKKPVKSLSKGNIQKLGIVLAMMHRPEVIILDEPTSGLDPLIQQAFYTLASEANQRGATIFLSSHNLNEVQRMCDTVAFIRGGKIVGIEDVQSLEKLGMHNFVVHFARAVDDKSLQHVRGVQTVTSEGNTATIVIKGSLAPFLSFLATHDIVSMSADQTPLEDIFMHYYKDKTS